MAKNYSAFGRELTKGKRGKYLYNENEENDITDDVLTEHMSSTAAVVLGGSSYPSLFDFVKNVTDPDQILLFQGDMRSFKEKHPFCDHNQYVQYNGYVIPKVR